MVCEPFDKRELKTVEDALDIAEDVTGNFYKFSTRQWKRHPYEVKTLIALNENEISKNVFALLNKGSIMISMSESRTRKRDCYFICLQDDQIIKALRRDTELTLLPLLVYVFTHELIHIVRFGNFFQRFDVSGNEKDKEEKVVHSTTFDILKDLSLPKLPYVLDSYRDHRVCELAV